MTVKPPVTMIVDVADTENVAWCTPRTLANVETTPARELSVPGLQKLESKISSDINLGALTKKYG